MTDGRRGELRIGDAEREAAVQALGEHFAAGRLTKDEYDERADLAWSARTASALAPLFADLPGSARREPVEAFAARTGPVLVTGERRYRFSWWLGPPLIVLLVLVVLTHLPVFLLVGVLWLLWSRHARPGGHRSRYRIR
jgi:hypothetical protein